MRDGAPGREARSTVACGPDHCGVSRRYAPAGGGVHRAQRRSQRAPSALPPGDGPQARRAVPAESPRRSDPVGRGACGVDRRVRRRARRRALGRVREWATEFRARAATKLDAMAVPLRGAGHFRLVHFLVRHLRPEVVLETGVGVGYTSQAILLALELNGSGTLYSSDFPYFRMDHPERYVGCLVDDELRHRWHLAAPRRPGQPGRVPAPDRSPRLRPLRLRQEHRRPGVRDGRRSARSWPRTRPSSWTTSTTTSTSGTPWPGRTRPAGSSGGRQVRRAHRPLTFPARPWKEVAGRIAPCPGRNWQIPPGGAARATQCGRAREIGPEHGHPALGALAFAALRAAVSGGGHSTCVQDRGIRGVV